MATHPVETSVKVYRALLRLYPTDHRTEYGPHMLQVFRDCCREGYGRDQTAGLLRVWAVTLIDLLKSALEERARTGISMNRKQTAQLGSICGAVAGALLLTGLITTLFVRAGPYDNDPAFPFVILGVVLVGPAILGISRLPELDSQRRARGLRTGTTILAGLGLLGFTAGLALSSVSDSFFYLWFTGYFALCLSSAALGIALALALPSMKLQGMLLLAGAALMPLLSTVDHRIWYGAPFAVAWIVVGATLAMNIVRIPTKPAH